MTRSSKTILLVEDNPTDEKLTRRAFKQSAIDNELVLARDGVEALDYLFGTPELPGLVLLDLGLPRLHGLEVLRQIRANTHTRLLPTVILTASRQPADVVRSYSLGANAFVRKPVELPAFVTAARTLGLFWLLVNEPPPHHAP